MFWKFAWTLCSFFFFNTLQFGQVWTCLISAWEISKACNFANTNYDQNSKSEITFISTRYFQKMTIEPSLDFLIGVPPSCFPLITTKFGLATKWKQNIWSTSQGDGRSQTILLSSTSFTEKKCKCVFKSYLVVFYVRVVHNCWQMRFSTNNGKAALKLISLFLMTMTATRK